MPPHRGEFTIKIRIDPSLGKRDGVGYRYGWVWENMQCFCCDVVGGGKFLNQQVFQ